MGWIVFRKMKQMDWMLFLVMLVTCAASVALVYSATFANDRDEFRLAYRSQVVWIFVGLVFYFICALIDYRTLVRLSLPVFVINGILLVLVLFIGRKTYGARRWIWGIQPAEFAKIAYILFMALLFKWREAKIKHLSTFCGAVLLTIFPMALILKQPDLGSAAVFFPILFMMMFVGGIRFRYLLVPVLVGLIVAAGVVYCVESEKSIPGLKEYQMNRIRVFFNPDLDRLNAGWTINQSLIAIGSGGMEGKGWLQGTQINMQYLPGNIGYTDFIFAVLCEQLGFRGGAGMILLQGLIILCCLRIGIKAGDSVGSVLVAGIVGMWFTHAFVNMGMTFKVVPITGIPLPLVSYGGTFLIVCMSALGVVQSVWIHRSSVISSH